jgi:hypothetical protein
MRGLDRPLVVRGSDDDGYSCIRGGPLGARYPRRGATTPGATTPGAAKPARSDGIQPFRALLAFASASGLAGCVQGLLNEARGVPSGGAATRIGRAHGGDTRRACHGQRAPGARGGMGTRASVDGHARIGPSVGGNGVRNQRTVTGGRVVLSISVGSCRGARRRGARRRGARRRGRSSPPAIRVARLGWRVRGIALGLLQSTPGGTSDSDKKAPKQR